MSAMPLELVTLLSSSVLGGAMKVWARSLEARREERNYVFKTLNARARMVDTARRHGGRGFQWTRRTIALTAVFFVIAFPKLVAVFMPEVSVFIGYAQTSQGFWFFTSGAERIVWEQMQGLVITPLDTHLLAAIVGLYFGGSLTN